MKYLATKRNEVPIHATIFMSLQNRMLSEKTILKDHGFSDSIYTKVQGNL